MIWGDTLWSLNLYFVILGFLGLRILVTYLSSGTVGLQGTRSYRNAHPLVLLDLIVTGWWEDFAIESWTKNGERRIRRAKIVQIADGRERVQRDIPMLEIAKKDLQRVIVCVIVSSCACVYKCVCVCVHVSNNNNITSTTTITVIIINNFKKLRVVCIINSIQKCIFIYIWQNNSNHSQIYIRTYVQ